MNAADSAIFQAEKQLKEYGEKIPADKKSAIESALNKLKDAHKSQDLSAIESAQNELNTAWQAASEDIYKATQGAGGGTANPFENMPGGNPFDGANPNAGKTDGNKPGGVTDVDFEEVK